MATRTWSSSSSTDMNLGTNYTPSGTILATDDLVFNGTSVINAIATAPLSVQSIAITNAYTGSFIDSGFAFTVASTINIDAGGNFNCSGIWTQTGDANFSFNSAGSTTVTDWSVVCQGTGTISFNKAATYKQLSCAFSGKVSTINSINLLRNTSGYALIINGGTFTSNGGAIYVHVTVSAYTPVSITGGSTINGSGTIYFRNASGSGASNFPEFTSTGTLALWLATNSSAQTSSWNLQGAISAYSVTFSDVGSGSAVNLTVNTNNYSVTATSALYFGASNAASTVTLNCGSSTITTAQYIGTSYNLGVSNMNFQTSQWVCSGNWAFGSNHTVTATSDTTWTFTGASSTLTIPAMTITATGVSLVFNGTTGCTLSSSATVIIKALSLGSNAVLTNSSSAAVGITTATGNNVSFGSGSQFTNNGVLNLRANGTVTIFSYAGTYVFNGNGAIHVYSVSGASDVAIIPGLIYTGTGLFDNNGFPFEMRFTGAISLGGAFYFASTFNSASLLTTNGNNITCTEFRVGKNSGTGSVTVNMGASNVTCTSFNGSSYNLASTTINMQSSVWTVAGSWSFGSNHVVNYGTSSVTLTNTATVLCAGKAFYTFIVNASGKTITLTDDVFTNTYTLTAGSVNRAGFYIFQKATSNVWIRSGSASTWNNISNWSLGHLPISSEDVLFDGSDSTQNITWDISPSVNVLGFMSNYSGTVTMAGYDTTVVRGFYDYGPGAKDYGNSITITGDGNFHVDVSSGTTTCGSCNLTMRGTGVIELDKSVFLNNMALAYTDKTTTVANGNITAGCQNILTVGAGTLTTNSRFALQVTTQTNPLVIDSSATLNGTNNLFVYFNGAPSDLTMSFPAFSSVATGSFQFYHATNARRWVIDCSGAVSSSASNFQPTVQSTGSIIFNTNNYPLSLAGILTMGSGNASGSFTANMGSSIISISSFGAGLNLGTSNFNLQSSRWDCSGNWAFGTNHTVNPGSSLITFVSPSASAVTSAGKSFNDIVVNNVSKAFSFADAASLHDLTTVAMASYTSASTTVTSSGNVTFNGSGTFSIASGFITLNGASSNLTIGSTVGSVTSGGTITMNTATAGVMTFNKNVVFGRVIMGADATASINGPASTTFSASTTPLVFTDGGVLTINVLSVSFNLSTTPTTLIGILGKTPFINGTAGKILQFRVQTAIAATFPALTVSTVDLILDSNASGSSILNLTGPINCDAGLQIISAAATTNLTVNTQNNSLICGKFKCGTTSGAILTANYGSSAVSCLSYDGTTTNVGTSNLNFQNSRWDCSGNWAFGSTNNVAHQWDSMTFTNDATLTTAGKPLNYLILNAPGKTVTLADNLKCHGYQNIAGTLNNNGKQVIVTGDYVECQIETSGVS